MTDSDADTVAMNTALMVLDALSKAETTAKNDGTETDDVVRVLFDLLTKERMRYKSEHAKRMDLERQFARERIDLERQYTRERALRGRLAVQLVHLQQALQAQGRR